MAYFNCRNIEDRRDVRDSLLNRYEGAEDAQALSAWSEFVDKILGTADFAPHLASKELDELLLRAVESPRPTRPTVFVSHQRADSDWAERVAWEAADVGFDYWLDMHDLGLRQVATANLPPAMVAVLVAGIIEIALLNCTHIVSLQTTNSQRSRWVPYEIGRAKVRVPLSTQAACWFETGVAPDPLGDYLLLTMCVHSAGELRSWLGQAALAAHVRVGQGQWRGGRVPPELPN